VTVTLLYFPDCPHWRLAEERLQEALALAGRDDVRVEHRVIDTPEHASAAGFRGSPTVLIDGRELFGDTELPVGLTCRVYQTADGLVGAPPVAALTAALRAAS